MHGLAESYRGCCDLASASADARSASCPLHSSCFDSSHTSKTRFFDAESTDPVAEANREERILLRITTLLHHSRKIRFSTSLTDSCAQRTTKQSATNCCHSTFHQLTAPKCARRVLKSVNSPAAPELQNGVNIANVLGGHGIGRFASRRGIPV